MPPLGLTSSMLAAPAEGPRRILTIEGGGVRGLFSLQILRQMEHLLRQHYGRPDMVLADHFHLVAGTSVGAILASFISWGWPVERLSQLFDDSLHRIFSRALWWKLPFAAFRRGPLREILQREFAEHDGSPAMLGTQRLRTWLLIVMRNLSTGSAWPLLNHPDAMFNRAELPDGSANPMSNLQLPLWQLIRASTAAPWFFPPERVTIAPGVEVEFIDGGVTAYNNPSGIAYLMATLPCYPLHWRTGTEHLHLISVGAGSVRSRLGLTERWRLGRFGIASKVPASLIESVSQEQDLFLRSIGRCEYGEPIDSEIGDLANANAVGQALRYSRFNHRFTAQEVEQACSAHQCSFSLSAVRLAPWLKEQGRRYAESTIRIEHLL